MINLFFTQYNVKILFRQNCLINRLKSAPFFGQEANHALNTKKYSNWAFTKLLTSD